MAGKPHLRRIQEKIFPSFSEFEKLLHIWRFKEERIVFTNGCFDLLHPGHADYLSKAADLGTRLVVGLNTDASVQRLKGAGRPLQDEHARALLLASFSFTDAVVLFGEDTPEELIAAVNPHVLVKGADYRIDQIAGARQVKANGGEVLTIEFLPGYSTSAIVQKIRSQQP